MMIEIVQIIAFGVLGRLAGSKVGGKFTGKAYMSFLQGCLFLPNYELALIVFLGMWLGNVMRDSIFDLVYGWDSKAALKMTLKGLWYAPVFVGVGFYSLVLLIPTFLLRAPIQYLTSFLPLATSRNDKGTLLEKLFYGRAEIYEFTYSVVIGAGLWISLK